MTLQSTLQAKLEAGLLEMGLLVSPEKQAKLIAYVLLIDKWNKVHNLTAIRDPLEMVTLHLLDSLSVLPHVQALAPKFLLDVGAGAGLPSIPLAICLPDLQVTAIDSVTKKTSFMRQVKGELGLSNFHVEAGRVEALKKERFNQGAGFNVIISRAFSEIALFISLTKHLLAENGLWLAMKGVVPDHEFESQDFKNTGIQPSKIEVLKVAGLDAERHLVFLSMNK
ncbi:16S rRNA (guanine(527)-N(7))-methyltransferase RsmG [Methylotenera sp.]|uniref:16S rRNA (guanine(527)-N(7))-methyltransferase RsmG n=1 Tax=Methylotenera sp. TaxID=2051956 RepID=UPI002723F2D2|nr:16S rRNA (guanine(527)-N(7))-methyltransferase RsmG [Methylotenera sp.]MDO9203909.1 16S rRNA (guanine(527)-N(7))-methyltransferase RsmG [Methylotenera sp.]MDP3942414.1 16S rRNA (guanine(527)-N(7))-methyltransferase RsmG [Methylotenera sp.]